MNRNVSATAKVLGVDAAQVKRWAFQFNEYLSPGANPAKGKARSFSDGDILVLSYVSYYWENDPDMEAIRIGLNREHHFEDAFVQNLYLHTPLLQEPPDDLDETWRHGILLAYGAQYQYLELARSYRIIAESLLQSALEEDDLAGRAYPILFAYRHTLELYLKLIGEIAENTHSLEKCVEMAEKRHGKDFPSPIREWILELDKIDPNGTTFRYADENPKYLRNAEYWFDFVQFQYAMELMFEGIDKAILDLNMTGQPVKT